MANNKNYKSTKKAKEKETENDRVSQNNLG